MIKIQTRTVNENDDIKNLIIEVEDEKSTIADYIIVANAMTRVLKNEYDLTEEEIIEKIVKF